MSKFLKAILIFALAAVIVLSGNVFAAETDMSPAASTPSVESGAPTATASSAIQASGTAPSAADPSTTDPSTAFQSTHTRTDTTEVTIHVVWEDMGNQTNKRPEELKATLSTGFEVTLNNRNGWTATVTGLPRYNEEGQIIYAWTIQGLPEGYVVRSLISSDGGTISTATISYSVEQTQETVKIQWEDGDNRYGRRPQDIQLTLSSGMVVTLNYQNSWTATVIHLPKYADGAQVTYSWSEEDLPNGYALGSINRMDTMTIYTLVLEQYKAELLSTRILNEIGWDLEAAYQWSVDMEYEEIYTGVTVYTSANYGFEHKKGDCFAKACTFCVMARALGYDCKVIYGTVPYARGGYGDHAWCEIVYEGELKVCDPDFESDTGANGYMIYYGQKDTWKYVYGGIVEY